MHNDEKGEHDARLFFLEKSDPYCANRKCPMSDFGCTAGAGFGRIFCQRVPS